MRRGVLQIVGDHLERAAQPLAVAHEHASALERLVQPLVRIERDRVGQLDARQPAARRARSARRIRRTPRRRAATRRPGGRSRRSPAAGRSRRCWSIPPRRTRRTGVRPRRTSAAIAPARASRRIRCRSSVGSTRSWPGRMPSARAARAIDECAWSDTYATFCPPPSASAALWAFRAAASRAQASAVMFAAEPPLTSTPGRLLGIADPLLEQVEHEQLQPARPGCLHPRARVDVQRARDEVPERRGERSAGGDEREVARVVASAHVRQHVAFELVRSAPRSCVACPVAPAVARASAPATPDATPARRARRPTARRACRPCGTRGPASPPGPARADRPAQPTGALASRSEATRRAAVAAEAWLETACRNDSRSSA